MGESAQHAVARVSKNTIAQIVALAFTIISKLLINILIARLFGAERVGEFAFVMTFSLLFTFLATAGMPWALIREVSTHPGRVRRYAENGLSIVTTTGLLTIPLMAAVALLFNRSGDTLVAIGWVGLALVFDGLAQVVCAVFNGFERMELAAVVTIVQELAFLIMGAVVLLLDLAFSWLFVIYVPSRLMGFVTSWLLYRKLMGYSLRPRWDKPFALAMVRNAAPYAANMALGPVYLRVDVIVLNFFQGNFDAGIYEAATNIFYRFNVFARTINNALMPMMAREFETEAQRVRAYINVATKYQLAMGMPMSVAGVMLAGPLMNALYGQAFEQSAIVFGLLAPIITLRFINNTLATALTASDLQSRRSLAVAMSAVFNVALNLFVLPRYSFVGAAVTTNLTEVFFFVVLYGFLRKCLPHPLDFGFLFKPAVAGGMMALTLWVFRVLPLLPLLLLGGVVYLIAALAIGTFSKQEIQIFVRVVRQGLSVIRKYGSPKKLLGWI